MLVSNNVFKNRYVWDGSQTNFPISFPFLDNNHIQVWYAEPGQPDTDAVILGKEHYTVTGAGNPAGGVLTRTTIWAVGATIAIVRNVPITQLHQYTQYDNFPAESHEDALAKLTMICQQLDEVCSRAMTVPVTSEKNPQEYWQDILEQNQIALEASLRAVAAAEQAETCKTQACQCAQNALVTEGRINAAATGQITAINNAGAAQIEAVNSVAAGKLTDLVTEGNNQVGRVTSQGQTEVDRINAIGDTRHEEIATLGTQYVNTINTDGSKWVADINSAGTTNTALVNAAGAASITSVTETGNYQESRIIGVGSNTVQEVRQEAQVAKTEADRAKTEADRAEAEADRAQQVAFGELPVANHFVQGITRLATIQEHLDATDDTIAATPLGVKQVAQQFVNIVITQPAITGPDSVREQSTHAYSLQAKALLPDAKIVAFYYHIDELGPTPIKVDVPTASQAADVTIDTDIVFPGNIGTVNTLIVYAEDSYGNLSRYSSKQVEIRLNEPPNMSGFTHTIPATVARGTTYTVKMSGATDPDGDPITYKFDFGATGITATPNIGITDNQNIQFTLPKDDTKYPPSSTNKTYVLSFKVIATDSLGATNQVTITTTMTVTFDAPTIGSPRQGQTDFSPLGPITWGAASIVNNVATPNKTYLQVAEDAQFTQLLKDVALDGEITSVDFQLIHALPYNATMHCRSRYGIVDKMGGLWSNPVSFTTKVSLPKPTVTVKVNNVVTTSGSTATKTDADNNNINITVAAAIAVPTGETADKVEYQIADNLSFNNAYVTSGAAHAVNSAYRLALDGGFIAAAVPAASTYMRVRQTAQNIGAEGHKVDVISEWSDIFELKLLSASLTAPVPTAPATGTTNVPKTGTTLRWNNGTAIGQTIDKVQVQVATDAAFSNIVKDSGALSVVTSWSIVDLALNTTYYWRVRNNGTATSWSAWSSTFNFKTFVNELTSQPPITAPAANQTHVSRKNPITVKWSNPTTANAQGSVRYIVNVYNASWAILYSSGLLGNTVRSFNIPANTLPSANTPYIIQVCATLDGGTTSPAEYNQWKASALTITTSPPAVREVFRYSQTYGFPYVGPYNIIVVAGGGGGGGYGAAASSGQLSAGAGGGGTGGTGQYNFWYEGKVDNSVTIEVGAGGINGYNVDPPNSVTATTGGRGGDGGRTRVTIANTSFDLVSWGGGGGAPSDGNGAGAGGVGGPAGAQGGTGMPGGAGGHFGSAGTAGSGDNCAGGAGNPGVDSGVYLKLGGGGGGGCYAFPNTGDKYGCGGGGAGRGDHYGEPGWKGYTPAMPDHVGKGSNGAVVITSTWVE